MDPSALAWLHYLTLHAGLCELITLIFNFLWVAKSEMQVKEIFDCNHFLLPYSYSLYEPNSHALMEYNGGLEKAILRNS